MKNIRENKVEEATNLYGEWLDLLDKMSPETIEEYKVNSLVSDDELNGNIKPSDEKLKEYIEGAKQILEIKEELPELVSRDEISKALDEGKTITISKERFTPAKFKIKDGEVIFNNKDITAGFGDWLPHPTMNKEALLDHCAMMQREGFTVVIDEPEGLREGVEDNMNDKKFMEMIEEFKGDNKLYARVVDEIIEDSEECYGETLKDRVLGRLEDISRGLVNGTVSSLVYYSDTVAFFDEYWDEIYDYLDEMDKVGLEPLEAVVRNTSVPEVLMGTDQSKNWIVWIVYEEIAYSLEHRILDME